MSDPHVCTPAPSVPYCHLCTGAGGHAYGCDAGSRWVTGYGQPLKLSLRERRAFRRAWRASRGRRLPIRVRLWRLKIRVELERNGVG